MARRRQKGSGTIYYSRGEKRWIGELRVGAKRRVIKAVDKDDVERGLAELVGTPGYATTSKGTLGAYLVEWVEQVDKSVRDRTAMGYRSIVELHLIPTLGRTRLDDLTPRKIQKALDGLGHKGFKPGTRRNIRACLSKALGEAVFDSVIPENPARYVRVKGANPLGRPQVQVDDVIVRRLLDAMKDRPIYHAVALSLYTGLRQAELIALDWSDYRMKPPTLSVRRSQVRTRHGLELDDPKTPRSKRDIPLSDEINRLILSRYSTQGRPKSGFIFPSPRNPQMPVSASTLSHSFAVALKEEGLRPMRWHDLRHACATLLLSKGIEVPTVSRILGHANPSITLSIYAHVANMRDRQAAEALRFFDVSGDKPPIRHQKDRPPSTS